MVDDPKTKLQLTRGIYPLCWVLQVEDIHRTTMSCGYEPGELITMSRSGLEWQITVPKDGSIAEGRGVLPVPIQWPDEKIQPIVSLKAQCTWINWKLRITTPPALRIFFINWVPFQKSKSLKAKLCYAFT